MDRHAVTRRPRHLAGTADIQIARAHPTCCGAPLSLPCTSFDASVDLRDVQIAARHADPAHHDAERARQNLDCHQNCILAAYMACGT
jgi:integrase/recombinase XerD